MSMTPEQESKLARAQEIVGHTFENTQYLLSAITHPSATEGRAVKFSYELLEFLGDSILGALVASTAFHRFPDLDEGGLTRIKVALVSGASLSEVADKLGFADVIVFGSSETGPGRRGLHSALENVYEAVVAATGLRGNRANPMARASLYVLRNTRMPAVLVEFGFMDSTTDTPIILTEEFAEQAAEGVVSALIDLYDLRKKEEEPVTYEEWKRYMDRYLAERAELPASMPEYLEDAKAMELTDGSRPMAFVTREEAAVMARAAAKRE